MLTRSWFDALKSRFLRILNRHERRATARRGPAARGLKVESLEDRRVLAFVVPPVNYDAGENPQAIVSVDFNGDGFLDLAVANYSSSNVSVLLGNGSGGFGAKTDFSTGGSPRSLAVGDVSGDGKIDLVTANAGGDVSVLRGNGAGSFAPPDSILLPDQFESTWGFSGYVAQSPSSVAVGDFNSDGNLDLAVTGVASFQYSYYNTYYDDHAYVNVLLGNGSGGFNPAVTTSVSSVTYYWYSVTHLPYPVAVGRFNADGNDDLAIANGYGNVSVLLSNGSGSFSSSADIFAGYYPDSVASGDLNGDSRPDLVTANSSGNTVSVLLANSLGSFDPVQTYPAGSQPQSLAIANFNGDSAVDLVTANVDAGTVSVLLGTGTGSFKPPVSSAVGSSPLGVAVGDFNGTGGPDVASANSGSDNVSVLLNNGIWPALDAPSITLGNASLAEGQTGTTAMEFDVTLSAAPTQTVTVHYATADYSAVAGEDYVEAVGTLTFNPGDPLTKKISVSIIGDRVVENSEFFYLRLSDATNAFLARATGVGNIMDDEPRVSIDYGPNYFTEGNTGTTNAKFTVRLSAPYDVPVSVNLSAVEGDNDLWFGDWYYGYYGPYPPATLNTDFQDSAQTVTFNPGDSLTKEITVLINGDTDVEMDEHFFVNLDNLNYGEIIGSQAVGIIVDDEPRASISGAANVVEGNTGDPNKTMTFTITLSSSSLDTVQVNYATGDYGSATAGSDYVSKTGTAIFNPGELTKNITIDIIGDRLSEYDEYLYVNLTGATGAALGYSTQGYGTIVDNEPRLSINDASITEGNSGTKLMTFTVTLSAAYDQTVTVNYATQNYTATSGSDYVAKSGTLTFNPGQLTQTFTVTINGDKQKEPDEYFEVLLSGASSNAMIWDAYGLGTILNDEPGKGSGKGPGKP
ncbi:MAG: FG-GAP-like repeat-containing protein [Planctomycetales bacterium]|nr:FG-GAP-like repeat-containing protein [Planctomycetales bacterium]